MRSKTAAQGSRERRYSENRYSDEYYDSDDQTDTYADFDYNNEDDSVVFENFKDVP